MPGGNDAKFGGVFVLARRPEGRILILRNQKVMLSTDLAEIYEVEPKKLMQAVQRNLERFPADFMFQLSEREFINLKSQIVTSSWGCLRKLPIAFSEQGIAMLSSVLRSARAIQVNIQIMREFIFDTIRSLIAPTENRARRIGVHDDET